MEQQPWIDVEISACFQRPTASSCTMNYTKNTMESALHDSMDSNLCRISTALEELVLSHHFRVASNVSLREFLVYQRNTSTCCRRCRLRHFQPCQAHHSPNSIGILAVSVQAKHGQCLKPTPCSPFSTVEASTLVIELCHISWTSPCSRSPVFKSRLATSPKPVSIRSTISHHVIFLGHNVLLHFSPACALFLLRGPG